MNVRTSLRRGTLLVSVSAVAAGMILLGAGSSGAVAPPNDSDAPISTTVPTPEPGPADKVNAPGTDLADYPKLPVVPRDPSLQPSPESAVQDVTSYQINADGSGSETIYSPVAGLTAAQLYSSLAAQGVSGLVAPAGVTPDVTPDTLTSCKYGTARLFRCAGDTAPSRQVHWANSGHSHPQVIFVDHTGSNWPVTTSTYVWNQAHGIDSTYHWSTCPSGSGLHCVSVTDSNKGNSCWQGLTTLTWSTSSYNISSAKVQFNDYQGGGTCSGVAVTYKKDANGYRQDACHEMGHALGMGHNTSKTNSCLYSTILNSSKLLKPDSNDFTLIASLYSTKH